MKKLLITFLVLSMTACTEDWMGPRTRRGPGSEMEEVEPVRSMQPASDTLDSLGTDGQEPPYEDSQEEELDESAEEEAVNEEEATEENITDDSL